MYSKIVWYRWVVGWQWSVIKCYKVVIVCDYSPMFYEGRKGSSSEEILQHGTVMDLVSWTCGECMYKEIWEINEIITSRKKTEIAEDFHFLHTHTHHAFCDFSWRSQLHHQNWPNITNPGMPSKLYTQLPLLACPTWFLPLLGLVGQLHETPD